MLTMITPFRSWISGILLGSVLALPIACGDQAATRAAITPLELQERLALPGAPLILDVRGPWEFRSGHIATAFNIPYAEFAARVSELEYWREREILVYGESGAQADEVADILARNGFGSTLRLVGDMPAWRRDGLPEER